MSNLMDLLTGGADHKGGLPGLLGKIGQLPFALSPGSQAPVPVAGAAGLDPEMQDMLQKQYQRQYMGAQARAIQGGAGLPGASAQAGAAAQDDYGRTVQNAIAQMKMLRDSQAEDARTKAFEKLISDPGAYTPQQRAALAAMSPEGRDKFIEQTMIPKETAPMSGPNGSLWVKDPTQGWQLKQPPASGGIPASAHYDEKRAGFAWADQSGPHFAPLPGAKPDMGADMKPQLVEVRLPDGQIQKQWVVPGQVSGVPVGDPYNATTGAGGGSRARAQMGRILLAFNQVTHSAENVVKVPVTATVGFLGGTGHSASILGMSTDMMNNKLSDQDTQTYHVLQAGLQRNLAGIESAGLAPAGSLTSSMAAVVFQPGDTQITKLGKLAEIRQIAEVGAEYAMTSPDVTEEQKQQLRGLLVRLRKAIPFTQAQVLQFQYSTKKGYTMQDAMKDLPEEEVVDTSVMPPS
jgi:hypothetical protein